MKPEPLIQCGSNLSTQKNAHLAMMLSPVAEQRPDLRSCPLLAGLLLWRHGQMDWNFAGRNRVFNRPWSSALRLHWRGNDGKRHPGCKTNLLVRAYPAVPSALRIYTHALTPLPTQLIKIHLPLCQMLNSWSVSALQHVRCVYDYRVGILLSSVKDARHYATLLEYLLIFFSKSPYQMLYFNFLFCVKS